MAVGQAVQGLEFLRFAVCIFGVVSLTMHAPYLLNERVPRCVNPAVVSLQLDVSRGDPSLGFALVVHENQHVNK